MILPVCRFFLEHRELHVFFHSVLFWDYLFSQPLLERVPSMALILLVQVQPRVFTAKCSESQVNIGNGMDGGSGVAKFLSLRTET